MILISASPSKRSRRVSDAQRPPSFHLIHVIHLTDDRRSSAMFAGLAIDRTKDNWTEAVEEASVYSVAKHSNAQTFKRSNAPVVFGEGVWYNVSMRTMPNENDCAVLSSEGAFTLFSYGGRRLKFSAPYSLKRYVKVKKWDRGYIEVDTEYANGIEEEYIDLEPILENLFIRPSKFLKPIKRVEIRYAKSSGR